MKTYTNYLTWRVVGHSEYPDKHNYVIAVVWSYQLALQIKSEDTWLEVKKGNRWVKFSKKK